jgi:hypothetical protein
VAPEPRGFAGLESLIPKIEVKPLPASSAPASSSSGSATAVPAPPAEVDRDTGPLAVKIILGLVIVGIIWAIIANNSDQSSSEQAAPAPASSASPNSVVSVGPPPPAAPEPVPTTPAWTTVTEVRPDTIYKPILSANEIAYCLAEDLRMSTVKLLVNRQSQAEIAGFNAKVENYNERCAQFEYNKSDMDEAQAYLEGHRSQIVREARTWPARWRRTRSTTRLQVPPNRTTTSLLS